MTQTTKELPNIRLLVLDVDGTLTDGSICMGPAGEVCKLFSVKDGLGIQMLAAAGIQVAVITGRTSEIVARRMAELPVARVVQGCADKPAALKALCEELGISPAEAAFFGDDLNDLAAMEAPRWKPRSAGSRKPAAWRPARRMPPGTCWSGHSMWPPLPAARAPCARLRRTTCGRRACGPKPPANALVPW